MCDGDTPADYHLKGHAQRSLRPRSNLESWETPAMDTNAANTESIDAANAASEAVRELNHATIITAKVAPSEAYAVIGALSQMLSRTPQALGQLLAALQHRHDAGQLAHDNIGIDAAMMDLEDEAVIAYARLDEALAAVNAMHNIMSGISTQ
jgi:hypothetical protein